MNRQQGMSTLALVLLLMVLGSLMLIAPGWQLRTYEIRVSQESQMIRETAQVQSALAWGSQQQWALQPVVQCQQTSGVRACVRLLTNNAVVLIAKSGELTLWRLGEVVDNQLRFLPHGWSDFCPLKELILCQMP